VTKKSSDTISIGYLARRGGISVAAIRFYEDKGLLHSCRSTSGHRRFRRSDLRRLSFIIAAKHLGMALADIRMQLDLLPKQRTPTKSDWEHIGSHFKQHIEDQINRLQHIRDKLDGCIGCGCLSLSNCHLYNLEDMAEAQGPGAVYLNQQS
jgi:MerR family redox-sensitive transcriptional activator SoxR